MDENIDNNITSLINEISVAGTILSTNAIVTLARSYDEK